ncbi:hypothetical protein DL96DRAFT_1559682 [Flagelloscypha sp. PMI_526]|nr:hypothetical protein DL96DRAFT_1559682 [Flagelloscypha sp. PMI_526]
MFLFVHVKFWLSCAVLSLAGTSQAATHQDSTVFATQYGRPLIEYARLARTLVALLGTNVLYRKGTLSTPGEQAVVAPNVDTLYGAAAFDLSKSDVVLTVPEVEEGRYYSFAFYDPFGSNFVNIGRISNARPGAYLVRRASDAQVPWGYAEASTGDKYKGFVNTPTTHGTLLARILVKNNSTDLTTARSILNSAGLATITRSSSPGGSANSLTLLTFAALGDDTGLATLRLTARLTDANPPFNISNPTSAIATLRDAGIYDGSYHQPTDVNPTTALDTALAAANAYAAGPGLKQLNNGWVYLQPAGLFGDLLTARTVTAVNGYLELVEDETIYPFWEGQLSLSADEAYLYSFASKPPLQNFGFWSLTLYDSTGNLVDNAIDKYSVGDRMYGGTKEGSFEVLVQSETPPSNWTANWLPAPAEGGAIKITLRLYGHQQSVRDGTWAYPVITKVNAITSS